MVLPHSMNVLMTSLNVLSAALSAEGAAGGNKQKQSMLNKNIIQDFVAMWLDSVVFYVTVW